MINATLTIPAGETTGRFSVRTNAEAVDEADESVHVVLNNLDGAVFSNGQERLFVQGVILDDEGTGVMRAAFVGNADIVEGHAGTTAAVFEVRLSQPSDEAITLDFQTRDGSATAGSDYTAQSGSVTFEPGQTIASVSVPVLGDGLVEGGEQFSLLVAPTAGDADQLAVDFAAGIATINDDDASAALPSVTITGGTIVEGSFGQDNLITYSISLSEPALDDVTFDYIARPGTAGADIDFDEIVASLTIPAGETSALVSVRTEADALIEADESVLVDFFNIEGAAFANGQDRTVVQSVILDDDGTGNTRSVLVGDAILVEGDSGSTDAVFEIRLSQPSDQAISFDYTTIEGSATSNGDFEGSNSASDGAVVFLPGQTVASIAIPVSGDNASEASESFQLLLTTLSLIHISEPTRPH